MKLQKLSLFGAVAGALMLTAAFAPRAEALPTELLYYFNFNSNSTNPNDPTFSPPYISVPPATFGTSPLRQTTMVNGEGSNLLPSLNVNPFSSGSAAGMTIQANGTTTNAFTGDTTAGNNLQLRGSTSGGSTTVYCFTLGGTAGMDFSGISALQSVSISFALQQLNGGGPGTGFTTLTMAYSLTGTTTPDSFTDFKTFTNLQQYSTYTTLNADLPTAVNGDSSVWVSFCVTGSSNAGNTKVTNIDNIQVNAIVPEPSTYIGGLLGIGLLCWSQRRRLIQSLRLRRT